MLFTSIVFLSFFLPLAICIYYLIPKTHKNKFLLFISLLFYIWGEKEYVILLLATIAINYGCCLLIERSKKYKKIALWTAVILSVGSLFYFKYATFAYTNIIELLNWVGIDKSYHNIPQIILPLGISFFTFQVLSYTIDVYRNSVHASHSFLNFATYVTLFPHLIAGPIVRYAHIEKQLIEKDITIKRTAEGIERFILGLVKKMFIANNCAIIADTIFEIDPQFYSPEVAWLAAISYSLQIYFDFSAYSDMAIGLARIFGFDFHENFNYPYISNSIKDFWRRWHISLSSWFRDYLYIPLGGSRISNKRTYINLLIIFLATGLWHGANWNFIAWGLWHGAFIVFERAGFDKILQKAWVPIRHLYLLIVVVVGWVFFRANDFSYSMDFIKRMFFINNSTEYITYNISSFITVKNIIIGIVAIIFCFPLYSRLKAIVENQACLKVIYYCMLLFLLICIITMLSAGTYNPFIYFRF